MTPDPDHPTGVGDEAAAASAGEPAPEAGDGAAEPVCPDVQTWVELVYTPTFPRKISQTTRWCASWWAHPEAIVRLTALWQSWEAARLVTDGSGMADWLRNYFDALNPVLLSPEGPFCSCTPDRHAGDQTPLPVTAPPADHWQP